MAAIEQSSAVGAGPQTRKFRRPGMWGRVFAYLVFAVAFGFTVALVCGLV